MPTLQRPPTLREIVMRSVLGVRDAIDTLIDAEERAFPEGLDSTDRITEIDLPRSRPMLETVAFELRRLAGPRKS